MTSKFLRWHAVVYYRTTEGELDVHHYIEELDELWSLLEHGPDWDALIKIEITYAGPRDPITLDLSQTSP